MQAYEWVEGRKEGMNEGRKEGRFKDPHLLFTSMTELNVFMMDTWIQT